VTKRIPALTDQETLLVLKTERARHPELGDTLDLHIAILEARTAVEIRDWRFEIGDQEARARLARGEPILRADELALDGEALARLFGTICRIAAKYHPEDADAFAELASQPSAVEETARNYLTATGHASRITHHATLANFVVNNVLHPFLAAYARALKPLVDDAAWYRAYCPICGGEPDFAALEKESGARRLLCARCDAEWTFHRALCPFCGEERLGYYPGSEGAYRLYTCGNCRRYLKTIDLRELAREVNLAAERVLTIGMDVTAREAGYR